jgi:diguanylate cyclase (GGDEF)-like protein
VLQLLADYLRSRVRSTDIVARLGGDEFALILSDMADTCLDEWLTALIHDYDHKVLEQCDGAVCVCQFSIGSASIDAQLYPAPADVFRAADNAMYGVKERRQIRHSRFAIAMADSVTPLESASGAR